MYLETLKIDGLTYIVDANDNNKVIVEIFGDKYSVADTVIINNTLYSKLIELIIKTEKPFKKEILYNIASLIRWEFPKNKINFNAQFYEIELCSYLDYFCCLNSPIRTPNNMKETRNLILNRFRVEKEIHTQELRVVIENLVQKKLIVYDVIDK